MRPHPPDEKSIPVAESQHLEAAGQICPDGGVVVLQPIAMRIPNSYGVYSPSKLRPQIAMSRDEFLARYSIHPIGIRVCFDETPSSATILQRSGLITAYGIGLDCWYIVAIHHSVDRRQHS